MNRKKRHRGERRIAHDRKELQRHQVQRQIAERKVADAEGHGDQREGDGKADEYRAEQHDQRQQTYVFRLHSHSPFSAAHMLFINSDAPCSSSSSVATGMASLNG